MSLSRIDLERFSSAKGFGLVPLLLPVCVAALFS